MPATQPSVDVIDALLGADAANVAALRARHPQHVAQLQATVSNARRAIVSSSFAYGGQPVAAHSASLGRPRTSAGRSTRASTAHTARKASAAAIAAARASVSREVQSIVGSR